MKKLLFFLLFLTIKSFGQLDTKVNTIDIKTKAIVDLINSKGSSIKITPKDFVPNVTYTNDTIAQAKTATSYKYQGKVVYKEAFKGTLPNTNVAGQTQIKTGIGNLLSSSGWLKCHIFDQDGKAMPQIVYNPITKYSAGVLSVRNILVRNGTTYNSRYFIIIYFTEP